MPQAGGRSAEEQSDTGTSRYDKELPARQRGLLAHAATCSYGRVQNWYFAEFVKAAAARGSPGAEEEQEEEVTSSANQLVCATN